MAMTNEDFVRFLYQVLFDRSDVSAPDVAHWVRRLDSGLEPVELVRTFLATPEGRHRSFSGAHFSQFAAKPSVAFHEAPGIRERLPRLTVVDVGAMLAGPDVYRPLVDSRLCRIVGFEPIQQRMHERTQSDPGFQLLPHVIGDGRPARFRRTASDASSSIYEPNLEAIEPFAQAFPPFNRLAEQLQVESVETVKTVRLDDVDEVADATYLKIDVQGAELDVLRGAERLLGSVSVIQIEVEFFPIYSGQPLFADLDSFLRSRGFDLFDLTSLERCHYSGAQPPDWEPHRLLWGDALYVREYVALKHLSADDTMRLAWVMHEVYRAYDFVRMLLNELEERGETGIGASYEALCATIR